MPKLKEMLAVIDEQRRGEHVFGNYMLETLSNEQLDKVEDFLRSFYADPGTDKVPDKTGSGKKERLDALEADMRRLREDLDAVSDRLTLLDNRHTGRHDQAMEIVGARIGELAERLDSLEDLLGEKSRSPGALYYASRIAQLADAVRALDPGWRGWKGTDGPASDAPFPTDAATTVDDALAAMPATDDPPRRGDRVRLEGARTAYLLKAVPDGWYDVIGWSETVDNPSFQIAADSAGWVPFIRDNSPAVKEIRRKAVAPTPRSPIEPADGLDV